MTLFVNGRFLTQPVSGVQRYAHEILRALDQILASDAQARAAVGPISVVAPEGATAPDHWTTLNVQPLPGPGGHLWEQGPLFRASRNGVLLSLGNSGPLRHDAHVLALHDAHIYQIHKAFHTRYLVWHRMMRPALARRAARLITVSQHSAETLGGFLRIDPARFSVIGNAADHVLRWPVTSEVPRRYGLTSGAYLMALGNKSPNKNIPSLIAAYRRANASVPDLVLVGGSTAGIANEYITGSGRVRVLGRVPDEDLTSLLAGAAALVFPSLHEGFGIPPLEAMQLGVPVLCARAGALPEVLGDAPMWFDPKDPNTITSALHQFASKTVAERNAMSDAGRQQAAHYSWRASAYDLIDLLAQLSRDAVAPSGRRVA